MYKDKNTHTHLSQAFGNMPQNDSFDNDPTTLLIRLLDRDPELDSVNTPTEPHKTTRNYQKFAQKRKKLEKLYSHTYDTLKATETRLKLNLPPSYIKFSITIPRRFSYRINDIIEICRTFFSTNNQSYISLLKAKLVEIETKLNKIKSTRNPLSTRNHLNLKEWQQIIKFKYLKTPKIEIDPKIRTIKKSLQFWQPKHYHYSLHTVYDQTKAILNTELKQLNTRQETQPTTIILSNQKFNIYKPSSYTSLIIPQNSSYTPLPSFVLATLDKGLKYTPHSFTYPLKSLQKEFQNFNYKLLWQNFFTNKREKSTSKINIPPPKLTNNRIKHKPPANTNITKYTSNLEKEFVTQIKNIPKKGISQETKNFYKTVLYFKANPKYIVKPVDKGSAIVIMHETFYHNLGLEFINSNLAFFKILETDPLMDYTHKINIILKMLITKNKINRKLWQVIKPSPEPKTPNLYFLPKIHKIPKISGRPICSSNNHPAENISN